MNNPLRQYGEAVKAQREGKSDEAAEKLSEAFGAEKVTDPIRNNTDVLTDPPEVLGEGLLRLMANGAKSRRRV
jgi:hypothetical protein